MVCERICPSTQIRLCGGSSLPFLVVLVPEARRAEELHGSMLSNGPHSQWTGQSCMLLFFC